MGSESEIVRAILRQNEFLFRRHLVLSRSVLDQMKESGLITDFARRKIMMEPPHKQVPVLINALQHQGLHSLRKFLDVLKNTGHGWMVDRIMDTDVNYSGGGRSKDDIGYRDRYQPAYTRSHAHITDTSIRRAKYDPLRPDLRKSITAAAPYYPNQSEGGLSLGQLFKQSEPPDPETEPRGIFHARTLFSDPMASGSYQSQTGPLYPSPMYGAQESFMPPRLPSLPSYSNQAMGYGGQADGIPMTLYGLNQAFSNEDQRNKQALSVLRQEEVAIRQLMEQNARDQGQLRRKQVAVDDIITRLQDIHSRAKDVVEPSPNPNIGRYRLAQLNQIPWS